MRPIKERKCLTCGETNEDMFYGKTKTKCKACVSNEYKNSPNKEIYLQRAKKWAKDNLIRFRVLAAKHRAIRHGIDFELTDDIIIDKLKAQDNKCFISKQYISMEVKDPYSLSLDRLDNDKGYTVENTIIVTKFINNCKSDLDLVMFIKLIKEACDNL